MNKRWALIAGLIVGASYMVSWRLHLPPPVAIAWKGGAVALLAVYAATRARDLDGVLLTAVMGFGAIGDVLLETHGLTWGALAFLLGHLTAIGLYWRNRRSPIAREDKIIAGLIWLVVVVLAIAVLGDRSAAPGVGLYAAGLGAMAGAAWLSRFPRSLTALGALLFAVSDLLIFLRTGRSFAHAWWMSVPVWCLYVGGQALIAEGVASSPQREGREAAPA